jgi:hypothetical protein
LLFGGTLPNLLRSADYRRGKVIILSPAGTFPFYAKLLAITKSAGKKRQK